MDDAAITAAIQRNLEPFDPTGDTGPTSHTPSPLEEQPENAPEFRSSQLARPIVMSADGQPMTVKSIGVGNEEGEWVIPTIVDGKEVSQDEAINLWKDGKNQPLNLYPFPSIEASNDWAQRFHQAEDQRIKGGNIFTNNLKKEYAAAMEGLTRSVGHVATAARRGLGLLTGESVTGTPIPFLPATADDTAKFHNDIADTFKTIEESTKGSTILAGLAKFAGAFAPIWLAGVAGGTPAVLGTFFAQGYEGSRQAAQKHLDEIDPEHTADHAAVANKVGLLAGTLSATLAHYIHLIPGADKLSGEAIESAIVKASSKELGQGAIKLGLQNIVRDSVGQALSQGAFTAGDLAVAKATYEPNLTLGEAAKQIAESAGGAMLFGGVMRGAKEIVRGGTGFYPKAQRAAESLEQAKTDLERQRDFAAETKAEPLLPGPAFKSEGAIPTIGLPAPHVSQFIGRKINSNGTPIGAIVGADETGLLVHYDGQLKATVLPYGAVGLIPGVNVRIEREPASTPIAPAEALTTGSISGQLDKPLPEPWQAAIGKTISKGNDFADVVAVSPRGITVRKDGSDTDTFHPWSEAGINPYTHIFKFVNRPIGTKEPENATPVTSEPKNLKEAEDAFVEAGRKVDAAADGPEREALITARHDALVTMIRFRAEDDAARKLEEERNQNATTNVSQPEGGGGEHQAGGGGGKESAPEPRDRTGGPATGEGTAAVPQEETGPAPKVGIRQRQPALPIEVDKSKPLEAQRIQIKRLMDQMEADDKAAEDAGETPFWNQDRFDKLKQALKAVEEQLLVQSKRTVTPTPEPAPTGAKPLPEGFTEADVRFLLKELEQGRFPLLGSSEIGIPTIHDLRGAEHIGEGVFRVRTPDFEGIFEGGGAMNRLPGGKAFTNLAIHRGTPPYDVEAAKAKLMEYLPAEAPAPTPAPEPEKPVGIRKRPTPKAPAPSPEPERPSDYGSKNKLVTKDQYKDALEKLKAKLKQTNTIDPEFISLGTQIAVYHAEAGARKFADFTKAMVADLGDAIRPYLKSLYSAVRDYPGMNEKDFDTREEVERQLSKPESQVEEGSQQTRAIAAIQAQIAAGTKFDRNTAHDIVAKIYGGTIGQGTFTIKDLTDIVEAAINRHIVEAKAGDRPFWDIQDDAAGAVETVKSLKALLEKVPTQTVRTEETDKLQQFSTPPTLAYVVDWVANLRPDDVVLEPSAGIGGLLAFPKSIGARTIGNELSDRRREILRDTGTADTILGENAEHLNALLRPKIERGEIQQPTAVVMNPPFSNAAKTTTSNTLVGAKHVEEALKLLPEGGRLVAIVGKGMAMQTPTFVPWWRKIAGEHNVRANIGIEGDEYRKYGTSFGNQILVIDKTGPTKDLGDVVTGQVEKIEDLVPLLEGVRNDRPSINRGNEQASTESSGTQTPRPGTPRPPTGGSPAPARPGASGAAGQPAGRPQGSGGAAAPVNQPKRPGTIPPNAGGGAEPTGRPTETAPGTVPRSDAGDAGTGQIELGKKQGPNNPLKELGVFTEYEPRKIHIEGAKPHPSPLVESTAMAAVEPVDPTYQPKLSKAQLATGRPSGVQIEQVVYAGQAHQQVMPNGERMGYFVGDGTGVGKGVEIASILLDNWNQGRKKALWVSASSGLIDDARRDLHALGFDLTKLINMWESGGRKVIGTNEGIAFMPYSSLRSGNPGLNPAGELLPPVQKTNRKGETVATPSRMHILRDWLGPNFDGVIVFDEAHKAGNALDIRGVRGVDKASQTGLAVVQLQRMFPKARIVYSSATGATEITNLSFADRLGIWGPGTPFSDKAAFFNQISTGGLSTMEMVARDLKAMGRYLARTLSFEGVGKEQIVHPLTPEQHQIYNQLADGWQSAMEGMNDALAGSGGSNSGFALGRARGAFFGAEQRFFNQLLTAMQLPTVIAKMKESLANGHAPVVQLVNTNEAHLGRELARKSAAAEDEGNENFLEDLDLSPKGILLDFLRNKFPTQLYEPVTDANGNTTWQPVVDAEGNAVRDPESERIQQELIDRIDLLDAPGNPLDDLINAFGEENVAELTGRPTRIVRKLQDDGTRKEVEERNRKESHRKADAKAFENDEKKILIFSDAAGTGYTFSSSNDFVNKRHRDHFGLQLGWRAANALQGFGRTHRSNQASPPTYYLVSTDLKGHQRFVSTIARRLSELGALTTGERKGAGGEMFDEMANLENVYAERAVDTLFRDLHHNDVPGFSFADISRKLGFTYTRIDPRTGEKEIVNKLERNGVLVEGEIPTIQQFLNRILALNTSDQNALFDAFFERMVHGINVAKEAGNYDPGTQTLKGLSIRKVSDEVVHAMPNSTAKTRLVDVDYDVPVKVMKWNDLRTGSASEMYVTNKRSGRVYALKEGPNRTNELTGGIIRTFRRIGPLGYDIVDRDEIDTEKYSVLQENEAKPIWDREVEAAPQFQTKRDTYVVGSFLPIWDRLRLPNPRFWRIVTDSGETMLGAHVPARAVGALRGRLGAGAGAQRTPKQVFDSLLSQNTRFELANGWKLKRSLVGGEQRIEVTGLDYDQGKEFTGYLGGFMERISYTPRFFVPSEPSAGVPVLERILQKSPIVEAPSDAGGAMHSLNPPGWERAPGATDQRFLTPDEVQQAIASEPRLDGISLTVMDRADHRETAGAFLYDRDGKPAVMLNAAAIASPEQARQVLREEFGHALLSTAEGVKLLREFASSRMTDQDRDALSRYTQRPGESETDYHERLANEFIAKAGREKNGFWRELIEKVKAWFAARGMGTLTNEEAARVILRKLATEADAGRLIPGSLPDGAVQFSMNPISSRKEFEKMTASEKLMEPEDALFQARLFGTQNSAAIGHLRTEFDALPDEVKKVLPMLGGRYDVLDASKQASDRLGTPGWSPESGDLSRIAQNFHGEPWAKAMVVGLAQNEMMNLNAEAAKYAEDTLEARTEARNALVSERQKVPAQRLAELGNEIINVRRGQLLADRATAQQSGNVAGEAAANRELGSLQNTQVAVGEVIAAILRTVPDALLTSPLTPREDIIKAWQARKASVPVNASPEVVASVERTMAGMPDLNIRLDSIKHPEKSALVLALEKRAGTMEEGHRFLQDAINSDQFKRNYEFAIDVTGSRGLVAKENAEHDLSWDNPLDPKESVTLRRGLSSDDYAHNIKALETAKAWFEDYLDPAKNPNPDPLKAEGIKAQLWAIDNIHLSQQFDPKIGKPLVGGANPFNFAARVAGGALDIPDYILEKSGGSVARQSTTGLVNYAEFQRASQKAHNQLYVPTSKATLKAAQSHKMDVPTWSTEIGDEVAGSYQNAGVPRVRVGMKVNGHTVTDADLAAVKAQKAYVDAQREAARESLATPSGAGAEIKILDVVGKTGFEREAQPTSELTMPQRLASNAIAFQRKWLAIGEDGTRSDAQKLGDWQDLLDGEFKRQALVGHVRSFDDPQYAADRKSPFRGDYVRLLKEINDTGIAPFNSVSDLVDILFDGQQHLPPEEQLSKDQIRAQVIKEINGAVKSFTDDERRSDRMLDPDRPQVHVVSSENFMNRPRGRRLLPKPFYTYTVGTEGEQGQVRFHISEVFAQRLLSAVTAQHDAVTKEISRWRQAIKEGSLTEEQIRDSQKAGDNFLNLTEAEQVQADLERFMEAFRTYTLRNMGQEYKLYQPLNILRGTAANAILQRAPTLLANYMGPVFQKALLDIAVLKSGKNLLLRFGPVGAVYTSVKGLIQHGLGTVNTAIGMMLNQPEVSPKIKALAAYMRQNQGYWSKFAGSVTDYLERQRARVEELKASRLMDDDTWRYNLDALTSMADSGGRLTGEKPTLKRKSIEFLKTAILMANETGLPFLQLPRALGVPLIESFNNAMAHKAAQEMVQDLLIWSGKAFKTRAAAGYDPQKSILTPQEIFGRKTAKAADAAFLRDMFKRAGLNLDRFIIEHFQRVQSGQAAPKTVAEIMGQPAFNALRLEMANFLNKGGFGNRPFYNSAVGRASGLFFGYGINQNAQLSRLVSPYSRDARNPLWQHTDNFMAAASTLVLMSALGAVYQPIVAYLKRLLYKEEHPVRSLWASRSAGEAIRTDLQNMAGQMPLLGRAFVNAVGAAAPGTAMSAFGMQLFPLSAANTLMQAFSKAWQTGTIGRPLMELDRQFFPNSRIVWNRTPFREGITTETAVRNILSANAPTGVEIKPNTYQTGAIQYGPARAQVDSVVNALSRPGGADMETVRAERKAGIAALVKAGKDPDDAAQAFDRSIIARNPFMATYGRNLTETEMAELRKSLPAAQLAELDTFVKGRQAYAREYGLNEPDYTKDEGGGGGRAPASPLGPAPMGRAVGIRGPSGSAAAVGIRGGGGAAIMGASREPAAPSFGGGGGTGVTGGGGGTRVTGIRGAGGRVRSIRSRGVRGLRASRRSGGRLRSFGLRRPRNSKGIRMRKV